MQATFIQLGDSIDYTPGANVAAGAVVVQGTLVGVARTPITASILGSLVVRGIFDVAKAAVAFTAGAAVYWDADGDPVGGTAGTGAATTTRTSNTFMGFALAAASETATTVRTALRSVEATAAEVLALADLSDVGALDYTAGRILVADGDSYEDQAVSGDVTLSGAGVASLNDAHAEQVIRIPVENLAAGADISARPVFVHPRACTLVSAGILTEGSPAGVDDSNTAVVALKDDAGNTIVTKTYNTGTQPPSSDYEDLGTLDETHKVLTAAEHVTLDVTQGATADLPAFSLVLRFIPTNA